MTLCPPPLLLLMAPKRPTLGNPVLDFNENFTLCPPKYTSVSFKARYRSSLDPTTNEVKRVCMNLRRSAKEERVLVHYNGHGVPKPTENGEIWVFNEVCRISLLPKYDCSLFTLFHTYHTCCFVVNKFNAQEIYLFIYKIFLRF